VRKAAAIGCSRILQRPHGNLLNRQENATCIWTCGQGSVRRRNVARTTGQLPHRQTCHSCTYRSSGHQQIHLKYLPIGESLCGNLRRTNHSVPQAKNAITDLWGEQVAQALHNRRGVVLKCDFPFVYREGMERVMKSFPEMFRVWVTKHVSHFQGTNCQLSPISKSVKNVCPSCGCHDEATSHITRCQDPGHSQLFAKSVEQLVQWLVDQQTDREIIYLFKRYLLARSTRTLTSLLNPVSRCGIAVS
jgi:hypothetical protein